MYNNMRQDLTLGHTDLSFQDWILSKYAHAQGAGRVSHEFFGGEKGYGQICGRRWVLDEVAADSRESTWSPLDID
jgi:hypothetical protein